MSVLLNARSRIEYMEVNELDKSTVVSIYPVDITEIKYTLSPGYFQIPAGSMNNPSVLTVGTSSWFRQGQEEEPILQVPVFSTHVAKSIVQDYCNGILGFDPDAMPGLFFVSGEYSSKDIKARFPKELAIAKAKQDRWFNTLINMADSMWSRTNGNPNAIADQMRLAAREMGKDDKPWLADFQHEEIEKCVGCGSMKKVEYPICPTCKAITNVDKAKALGLTFAQ